MKVATVTQMRAMDHRAITEFGIPELLLMENAGIAAFRVLSDDIGIRGRRFAVICGPGNNGGDGFVVARKILSDGGEPELLVVGDTGKYRGASRANFELMQALSIPMTVKPNRGQVAAAVARCDGIVDAILGTGLNQPVMGAFAEIIGIVNDSGKPVLSLDIPSGISGDTGRVLGAAVKSRATVTFGLPKVGTLLYPGFYHCGRLLLSHISFPPLLTEDDSLSIHINSPPPIPPRSPWGHKGSFGDILFIAGARGYYGAPVFAAMGALKSGGGYSRLAAPESLAPMLAGRGGEIVFMPQTETTEGSISIAN
ncbi:MAG: NAD(P)H-hydrate epimerase, partial [Desulfobacterales bacterium]